MSLSEPIIQGLNILIGGLFCFCGSKSKGYEIKFKCSSVGQLPSRGDFYLEPVDLVISKAALISSLTPISNGFVLDELVIFLIDQKEGLGDFSVNWFVKVEPIAAVWIETAEVV